MDVTSITNSENKVFFEVNEIYQRKTFVFVDVRQVVDTVCEFTGVCRDTLFSSTNNLTAHKIEGLFVPHL